MNERYFVKLGEGPWRETDVDEFVKIERQAGFVNTMGHPEKPGTGGFSDGIRFGRIVGKSSSPGAYDWDPEFAQIAWPSIA